MTEEMKLEVEFKELVNLGLNQKAENQHPQIDRLLREIVTNKVKATYPKIKNQPWHYTFIRYSSTTDKYFITIAPGHAPQKG